MSTLTIHCSGKIRQRGRGAGHSAEAKKGEFVGSSYHVLPVRLAERTFLLCQNELKVVLNLNSTVLHV